MNSQTEKLIDSLRQPDVWPDRPDRVELEETHISWVFLTREFAWKIKKPVCFDFLDFSTLPQRKHFCDQELRLNRRTAPELYLTVVPICGTPAAPEIDGSGSPIEFAVKMRRFEAEGLLSRMAAEQRVTPELIDALAEQVADLHRSIAQASPDSDYGRPEDIQRAAIENFESIDRLADGNEQHMNSVQRLRNWTISEGERLQETFHQRRAAGCIRECHGDLHLGNIVAIDGRPCLFDCVEFNDQFRWVDVINEIAFLVMDLEEHGEQELAQRLLNRYLECTGDYGGLKVLRYYLVYRAMVRAKIDVIRLTDGSQSRTQRRVLLNEFGNYLSIADHDTEPAGSAIMIMHGLSGSGKTTLSQRIVETVPAIRIRSDIERKRLFGLGEANRTNTAAATRLYSPEANRQTYARLTELATTVIQAGFSVIVDAAFLRPADRTEFRQLAQQLAVPFQIIACQAPEAELRKRVAVREAAGRDASDAGLAVLQEQLQSHTEINREPENELITVDTANEAAIQQAIERLKRGTSN